MSNTDESKLRDFGGMIGRLLSGGSLSTAEARDAYIAIFTNTQPDLQQGAFMAALHAKGANPAELAGVWQAFMDVEIKHCEITTPEPVIDICGTGADSLKTLNVSTGAAIIAAAAGAYVAKIGCPAITGKAGTTDTFEALGLETMAPLERAGKSIEQTRLGLGHAFNYTVGGIGRVLSQIRYPSSINLVGPLTTCFAAKRQVYGVFIPQLTALGAAVAREIGFERILVPCGGSSEFPDQYIDEFSNIGPTYISELKADGTIENYTITPAELGLKEYRYQDIATGPDAQANAQMIVDVLAGREKAARHDILCLNAAAVLYLADKVPNLKEGFAVAATAVADGRALEKLRDVIRHQNVDAAAGLAKLDRMVSATPVGTP